MAASASFPPSGGASVRVSIPVSVAANLESFQKTLGTLAERLGHPTCFSGRDCTFQIQRDFVVDEQLVLRARSLTAAVAQVAQPSPGISVTVPHSVGFKIDQIKSLVAKVAGELGHTQCCSGFNLNFQQEVEFLADQHGTVRGGSA
jgi:hypothetical protein